MRAATNMWVSACWDDKHRIPLAVKWLTCPRYISTYISGVSSHVSAAGLHPLQLVHQFDLSCVRCLISEKERSGLCDGCEWQIFLTESCRNPQWRKNQKLQNVSSSEPCHARAQPRVFTNPRLFLEAAEVFSTRIMKGSLTLQSVISRSRMVQVCVDDR